MTKLKVGDQVTIVKDLSRKEYGSVSAFPSMANEKGKKTVILEVERNSDSDDGYVYRIAIDNKRWMWTNQMFEDRLAHPNYKIY